MVYNPAKDDYVYDESLSLEENQENLHARVKYLYQWAQDNWKHSIHAPSMEARAQYLESYSYSDELEDVDESYYMDPTESMLEDHMPAILDYWLETGKWVNCENYHNSTYEWMLWAVGHEYYNTQCLVKEWLDENPWYDHREEILKIMGWEE